MSKQDPPSYGKLVYLLNLFNKLLTWLISGFVPPPQAPPSYFQAVNGVNAAAPLTPQQPILTAQHIVTTIVPLGMEIHFQEVSSCVNFILTIFYVYIAGPHSTHTVCPSCGSEIK